MEFRLLGPVEVRSTNGLVDLGPARQRTVLAALAVDVGRPVLIDTVIDRVWGEVPPERAREALYVYIARLRRILTAAEADAGADRPVRLLRRSGGYLLEAGGDLVDAYRFRTGLEQARERGCPDRRRVELLEAALDEWHGPPLAGLPGEWAARVRDSYQNQRVEAAVTWAEAQLRLGDARAVVDRLTDLVAEYPLVESLAAALMRALHAAGRAADALDCFAALRVRLAAELGADPGTDLRAVHRAILRGELEPVTTPAADRDATPALLPPDVSTFVGRDRELGWLDRAAAAAVGRATTRICVISGTAGVGKTVLALHWAHRAASLFPDGQLYVNLRGFDPNGGALAPEAAITGFLEALTGRRASPAPSRDLHVSRYRAALAGRRVLIVLDNARDAAQVRPLLPTSPGCVVLVTSRDQLTGLVIADGARHLTLDLLSTDEARRMLAERLGAVRVAAEPAAVDDIIAGCANLPLALTIVAARASTHPDFPLAALAGELRDGLDAFDGGEATMDVRAAFSWSYRTLGPDAAHLFRVLARSPGAVVSAPFAADLAGVDFPRARTMLAELSRAHLIREEAPGRYALHGLLRAYGSELDLRDAKPRRS